MSAQFKAAPKHTFLMLALAMVGCRSDRLSDKAVFSMAAFAPIYEENKKLEQDWAASYNFPLDKAMATLKSLLQRENQLADKLNAIECFDESPEFCKLAHQMASELREGATKLSDGVLNHHKQNILDGQALLDKADETQDQLLKITVSFKSKLAKG